MFLSLTLFPESLIYVPTLSSLYFCYFLRIDSLWSSSPFMFFGKSSLPISSLSSLLCCHSSASFYPDCFVLLHLPPLSSILLPSILFPCPDLHLAPPRRPFSLLLRAELGHRVGMQEQEDKGPEKSLDEEEETQESKLIGTKKKINIESLSLLSSSIRCFFPLSRTTTLLLFTCVAEAIKVGRWVRKSAELELI